MFRKIEIVNTIFSLGFNILFIIGSFQGIQIIRKFGFEISSALYSTLLLFTLIYFLSAMAFLILRNFISKNKLTEKNTKPEIKALPFVLYFVMAATTFPIWFFSSPTELTIVGQFVIILVGVIVSTVFIALITELFMFLSSDGGKYFKKRKSSV